MSGEIASFSDLKLNSWLLTQCDAMGLKKPTAIQRNCIPRILAGEDCIGCAKTGSGKTLAFALPILQKLCEDPYGIFALVLTPTRELAFQIADQFAAIGKVINLKKCVVVGGMDMVVQGLELSKRPHVVVATPGRLADHLDSCDTFSLKRIKFLVLDEADRLLGGHFDQQLKHIFAALVEVIRTFRATNKNGSVMVFTDTCKNCQLLSMALNDVGFTNVALHAMIKQRDRLAALTKFKSNHVQILIATDVAARGLDIHEVELVVNHVIPNVPKEYIHRVGRTARAGRNGMAVSLITPHDVKLLHAIEDTVGTKLTEYKVDDKEIVTILTQISVAKREAEIKLDETDFFEKKRINKQKKLILEGEMSSDNDQSPDEMDTDKGMGKKRRKKRREMKKTRNCNARR